MENHYQKFTSLFLPKTQCVQGASNLTFSRTNSYHFARKRVIRYKKLYNCEQKNIKNYIISWKKLRENYDLKKEIRNIYNTEENKRRYNLSLRSYFCY